MDAKTMVVMVNFFYFKDTNREKPAFYRGNDFASELFRKAPLYNVLETKEELKELLWELRRNMDTQGSRSLVEYWQGIFKFFQDTIDNWPDDE